ncbi:MAG: FMN-binding protein [Ruminococcaceae bacterium]|nr:FMN-binding protein [Oscillospiraceae bacterium]
MQKLKFLKPAIPLTVISVVIALLLAVINSVTAGKILENTLIEKEKAIKGIFPECESFVSEDASHYENSVSDAGKVLDKDGNVIGYYADVSPIGFKGEISLIVGTDTDGKVALVTLLSASETPGVGTKATDSTYLSNFVAKTSGNISEVATITGATISSKAVKQGVLSAVTTVDRIIKGGK